MSMKRQATSELNHQNWDEDDPSDKEEMGSFQAAAKDVLEKRVIRTAKRRSQASGDKPKAVFSGFGGFNKAQASSFDFLANLTNGNIPTNGSPADKNDTAVTSTLFSSKPVTNSSSSFFNLPVTSTPSTKSTFGLPNSQTSTLFGASSTNTSAVQPLFTASKADSTVGDSPYKIHATSSSSSSTEISKTTNVNPNVSTSQVSSTIFGSPSTNAFTNKSLFSATTNSSPFKIQPVSSTTSTMFNISTTTTTTKAPSFVSESKTTVEEKTESNKLNYYSKLKGLNESVSDWIKKHVEETPLCILTPIFKDYEKHLKEIQEEYEGIKGDESKKSLTENIITEMKSTPSSTASASSSPSSASLSTLNSVKDMKQTPSNSSGSSLFSKTSSLFNQNNNVVLGEKSSGFSFGINPSTNTSVTTSGGFSFGINTPVTQPTTAISSSPFSFTTNTTASAVGAAPFSFGTGKPFSFSPNTQNTNEPGNNGNEEEDEPPKVDFTPVVEENTVYDKRCKIFVKKEGNFVDKGVGTLYIKKVEGSDKHQLLVRANTNLGNILVNLILSSGIPTQRLGKNNVMLVCIPTPDPEQTPIPILIRVKTSEEADELLETLNKYKVNP